MDIKIIYEDNDLLVVDKPAGIVVFNESIGGSDSPINSPITQAKREKAVVDYLLEEYPKLSDVGSRSRFGAVHRLDKDTSGVLLVAKTNEALIFLQNQFKNRTVEKKYAALVCGIIKEDSGKIETLIGRSKADPRKQKAYPLTEISNSKFQIPNPDQSMILDRDRDKFQIRKSQKIKRKATTEYRVLQRFTQSNNSPIGELKSKGFYLTRVNDYTLLEVMPKTGRKHQIRCHLTYIHHPVAGDKFYGFKDSPTPEGLKRQFLHASYLKAQMPNGETKEFYSDLPEDLQRVLNNLQEV